MKTIRALLIALIIFSSVHGPTVCMGKFLRFAKRYSTYTLKNLTSRFLAQNEKNNNLFIFVGPPASGKGTLSKICVDLLGCQHVATGELCREQIDQQTPLGKQIDLATNYGTLIDDDLMLAMVEESLKKSFTDNTLIILDGFPRTTDQATKLDSLLHEKFKNVQTEVVQFVVNDDFVIEYSTNRLICPDCKAIFVDTRNSPSIPTISGTCDFCFEDLKRREDDRPEVVKKRLYEYRLTEKRLIDFYTANKITVIPLLMESTPDNPLYDQFDEFKSELGLINENL